MTNQKIFSLPDTALSSFIHLTKQRLMWNLKTASCQRCDDSRKIILPFKVILQSLRRKCFASSDKFHATVFLLLSLVYCVIEQALYKKHISWLLSSFPPHRCCSAFTWTLQFSSHSRCSERREKKPTDPSLHYSLSTKADINIRGRERMQIKTAQVITDGHLC